MCGGTKCNFDSIRLVFQKIIAEYRKRGQEFLFEVFNSSKCLEELSGISEMLNAQHDEVNGDLLAQCESSLLKSIKARKSHLCLF